MICCSKVLWLELSGSRRGEASLPPMTSTLLKFGRWFDRDVINYLIGWLTLGPVLLVVWGELSGFKAFLVLAQAEALHCFFITTRPAEIDRSKSAGQP